MKKNKGFTLVELLAIIVILAVLILMVTPTVIKVMNNAKKNAFRIETLAILKATENAYSAGDMQSSYIFNAETNDLAGYIDIKEG